MQDYTVRLDAFEGPMDLLMHLIEKNKIDIYDIPMVTLTEQYMDYLARFKEFNIEVASEFLVMAATLLLIKSRMMLPKPPKEEAEEEEDPRRELVERILEYRRFKEVSSTLDAMAEEQKLVVARLPLALPVHRLPPENLSVAQLLEAFRTVLAVREELTIPQAIVAHEEFSVEEQMAAVLSLLSRNGGQLSFSETFQAGTRSELITTFLALLELIRRKAVLVRQAGLFAEIMICVRPKEQDTAAIDDGEG